MNDRMNDLMKDDKMLDNKKNTKKKVLSIREQEALNNKQKTKKLNQKNMAFCGSKKYDIRTHNCIVLPNGKSVLIKKKPNDNKRIKINPKLRAKQQRLNRKQKLVLNKFKKNPKQINLYYYNEPQSKQTKYKNYRLSQEEKRLLRLEQLFQQTLLDKYDLVEEDIEIYEKYLDSLLDDRIANAKERVDRQRQIYRERYEIDSNNNTSFYTASSESDEDFNTETDTNSFSTARPSYSLRSEEARLNDELEVLNEEQDNRPLNPPNQEILGETIRLTEANIKELQDEIKLQDLKEERKETARERIERTINKSTGRLGRGNLRGSNRDSLSYSSSNSEKRSMDIDEMDSKSSKSKMSSLTQDSEDYPYIRPRTRDRTIDDRFMEAYGSFNAGLYNYPNDETTSDNRYGDMNRDEEEKNSDYTESISDDTEYSGVELERDIRGEETARGA